MEVNGLNVVPLAGHITPIQSGIRLFMPHLLDTAATVTTEIMVVVISTWARGRVGMYRRVTAG